MQGIMSSLKEEGVMVSGNIRIMVFWEKKNICFFLHYIHWDIVLLFTPEINYKVFVFVKGYSSRGVKIN